MFYIRYLLAGGVPLPLAYLTLSKSVTVLLHLYAAGLSELQVITISDISELG